MDTRKRIFTKFNHANISDKQINEFLYELEPIEHTDSEYDNLLKLREKMEASLATNEKFDAVIFQKPNKSLTVANRTNICQCCFEEIFRSKLCRMCGLECCAKCLVRMRILPGIDDPVSFCENCDKNFMEAMISKQFAQRMGLREKALKTLANEYEMMESLFKIEKHKIMASDEETGQENKMLALSNKVIELKSANHLLKSEVQEVFKKIQWGSEINKNLNKKYKKMSQIATKSFASVAQSEIRVAPPKISMEDEDEIEGQNLNESLVNSMLNENMEEEQMPEQNKCVCIIF